MQDFDYNVTKIMPIYNFQDVAGGYFEVYFGYNHKDPFKVSFVPFLELRVKRDERLLEYLKKTAKDKTISDSIYDLYDIGFPVDAWVREYIEYARDNVSANMFNALILFFNTIRKSNDKDGTETV